MHGTVLVHLLVFLSNLVPPDSGLDQVGVGVSAIGKHVDVALLLCPHLDGLRCEVPVEDLVAHSRCFRRSWSIGLTT